MRCGCLFSLLSPFLSGIAALSWPAVFWMHFLADINILRVNLRASERGIRTFTVNNSSSTILLSIPNSFLWKPHFKPSQINTLPTSSSLSSGLLILRCIGPMVPYSIFWELLFIKTSAESIKKLSVTWGTSCRLLNTRLRSTVHKMLVSLPLPWSW